MSRPVCLSRHGPTGTSDNLQWAWLCGFSNQITSGRVGAGRSTLTSDHDGWGFRSGRGEVDFGKREIDVRETPLRLRSQAT